MADMVCPRCGSQDVSVQVVNEQHIVDVQKKGHGLLWHMTVGLWMMPLRVIRWILMIPVRTIRWLLRIDRPKDISNEAVAKCVCQSCGHVWEPSRYQAIATSGGEPTPREIIGLSAVILCILSVCIVVPRCGRGPSDAGNEAPEVTQRTEAEPLAQGIVSLEMDGMSIEVPAVWEVDEADDGVYIHPDCDGLLYVQHWDAEPLDSTDGYYRDLIAGLTESGQFLVTEDPTTFTVGNVAAYRVPVTYTDGSTYRGWVEIVFGEETFYSVIAAVEESSFEEYSATIVEVLDSITLGDHGAPIPAVPDNEPAIVEPSNEESFINMLVNDGFNEGEARAVLAVLSDVGCGDLEPLDANNNGDMDIIRGMVNGHQVNVTTECKTVLYVQITGFPDVEYDWYLNWRGKLKFGLVNKMLAFDLYDKDLLEEGYIARYNAADDSVVPWDEL